TRVPSLVSIINRGPLSGSDATGAGALPTARGVVVLRVGRPLLDVGLGSASALSFGLVFSVSLFEVSPAFGGAGVRVLRPVGRRPRVVLDGAFVTPALVTSVRSAAALAVSALASFGWGDSTGVGSGVGAAATSAEGRSEERRVGM